MKIFRGDYRTFSYSGDDEYNQEIYSNIEKEFENFSSQDWIGLHEDDHYDQCDIFRSKEDAIKYSTFFDGLMGIRISEYDLSVPQMEELIFMRELVIEPTKVYYYSWNEETDNMDFVK